jgi:hypothetical protein
MTKKYNEIEVKDNMKVEERDSNNEEVAPKEKKQMEKVVTSQPKKVKKGLLGRLVTGLVGPEGLPGIGSYVNEEIVKPAIKNIIVDAVTSGINMVMYGERGGAPRGGRPNVGGRSQYTPRTDYGHNYRPARNEPERAERIARPARQGIEEYLITDRHEASQVLVSLTEYADRYDAVSVADYYDLIGAPSKYTDNNYGWTIDSITRASIIPVRGGYIIKFPPVEVI